MSDPIHIVTVWRKSPDFPVSTVVNLYRGCLMAAGDKEIVFHCLTNTPDDLPEPIVTHEAEHVDWHNYWSKIELFKPGLFDKPVIYFDLDTIVRSLDNMPNFDADGVWMIMDVGSRRRGWASGIMAWAPDRMAPFYHDFVKWRKEQHFPVRGRGRRNRDKCSKGAFPDKGDQQMMARRRKALGVRFNELQKEMRICSYKKNISRGGKSPELFDVICFHGKPRPQNCLHPWIKDYYVRLAEWDK